MKRIFLVIAIVFTTTVLIGCTDETANEIEERIEFENELKLIDKDDVETPTTKGKE